MGRPITVTIDSDDLIEMFYDRVSYATQWMKHYEDEEAFNEYYAEMVDSGVFDGMQDFNVANIVDNDVVNEIDTYTEDEYVKEFGTIDEMADRILFQASNGIILVSARG
jgi:hypothetical protein